MIKTLNTIKSNIINTAIVLLIGAGIGTGLTFWLIQKNLDGVCGLVSARNQFINFVEKDSK